MKVNKRNKLLTENVIESFLTFSKGNGAETINLEEFFVSADVAPTEENVELFLSYLGVNNISLKGKVRVTKYGLVIAFGSKPHAVIRSKGLDSMKKIVGDDPLRLAQTGVFFHKGKMVATDGRKLLIIPIKRNEYGEYREKVIDPKTNEEIKSVTFPAYEIVVRKHEVSSIQKDIEPLIAAINSAKSALNNVKVDVKALRIRLGDVSILVDPQILLDLLLVMRANGTTRVVVGVHHKFTENGTTLRIDGDNGIVGVMASFVGEATLRKNKSEWVGTMPLIFEAGATDLGIALEALKTALEFAESQDVTSLQNAITALTTAQEFV